MNKPVRLFLKFFFHEPTIYLIFCTGIIYSMFLWPLLNSILCISLGVYWLLFSRKTFRIKSGEFRRVILFSSLFFVSVAGMFYTANLHEGFFRLQQQAAILLFPVALGFSEWLDLKMTRTLLTHFLLACIFTALLGLTMGWIHYAPVAGDALNASPDFLYPESYPYIMGLNCLLALIVLAEKQCLPFLARNRITIPAIIFLSAYLLILNVRLISACWLVILIYYIYRMARSWTYRILMISFMLFLVVLAFLKISFLQDKWDELKNYPERGGISLDKDASLGRSWGGASIRIALWKCSVGLLERHPLTGVGTGDIQDSLQQAYENRKFYFASRYNRYNIHNQYLHMILGYGVGGLIILLACIAVPAFSFKGDPFVRIRFLFLLLFFLICFTEVILETNKGIIWYSFFNSIFAFGTGQRKITNPAANQSN